MTRWLFCALSAMALLAGCPDSGDDDSAVGDDDTTHDLGCNEPSTRTLGWDEEVDWWMDTAGEARDALVGTWSGDVPWDDGTSDPLIMTLGEPLGAPVLTTYPDAEPDHALDACNPWATFDVPFEIQFPGLGITASAASPVEVYEQTNRWYLFAWALHDDCGDGVGCQVSLNTWADPGDEDGTLLARMTLIVDQTEYHMDSAEFAVLER